MKNLSIIGGTGMKSLFEHPLLEGSGFQLINRESVSVSTEYGSVPVTQLTLSSGSEEHALNFIHRHHGPGVTPPHSVNYRANVTAAASSQPEAMLTIQSVGSLVPGLPPGTLGFAADILNLTGTVSTFHDDDAVHVDLSNHFRKELRDYLRPILMEQEINTGAELFLDNVVAQMNGPQFETIAEVRALHILGATLVGMTLSPEARLVAELGLPQIGLVVSSNWASGFDPAGPDAAIDHESVEDKATQLHVLIWRCILALLRKE